MVDDVFYYKNLTDSQRYESPFYPPVYRDVKHKISPLSRIGGMPAKKELCRASL